MYDLSFLRKDPWISSYKFVKKQVENSTKSNLNLYLLKSFVEKNISEEHILDAHDKLIDQNLIFIFPSICTTDKVFITKNLSEFREYRFFSFWGLVYYNALALYFFDLIETMELHEVVDKTKIASISPSKISKGEAGYKIKTNYKGFYNEFVSEIENTLDKKQLVLSFDIRNFYGAVSHEVLLGNLEESLKPSVKAKYQTERYRDTLKFCFRYLMLDNKGIPQGKRIYASDLFGDFYLKKFDLQVEELCNSDHLKFIKMVRYVDDIFVFFDKNGMSDEDCLKEGLRIEKKVSLWLHNVLRLDLNHSKTKITNIKSDSGAEKFLEQVTRITSKIDEDKNVTEMLDEYLDVIGKLNYKELEKENFLVGRKEKNILKYIFKKEFKSFISTRTKKVGAALALADVELAAMESSLAFPLYLYKDGKKDGDGKYPFKDRLDDFFMSGGSDLSSKSNIEVAIQLFLHNTNSLFKKEILGSVDIYADGLVGDSLGKYLLFLTDKIRVTGVEDFSIESIPYSICGKIKNVNKNFEGIYRQIYSLSKKELSKDQAIKFNVIISQLSLFFYSFNLDHYGAAFNHFHSFYEETLSLLLGNRKRGHSDMKKRLRLLNDIVSISPQDRLKLGQFSDRRNFNIVSHASNRDVPTKPIEKGEIVNYVKDICVIYKKYNFFGRVIVENKK